MNPNRVTLMSRVIAAALSQAISPGTNRVWSTFQARGETSAGAGAAQIEIWGSNVEFPVLTTTVDWVLIGTIDLVLATTRVSGGFVKEAPWTHIMAKLVSISGTDATIDVYMG